MSQAETPTRPGPGGMAGDHRQAGFSLHQQVVRLHRGVLAGIAVAGDVDGDQPRMALAQFIGAEARTGGGAGGQVLDEHVGPPKDAMQQRGIVRPLDVGDQALLAAIEPDEIAGQASCRLVVAAREVALGALDLDHPRAGVGQARAAIRRGDRLFERDDKEVGQRQHRHPDLVALVSGGNATPS